MSDLTQEEKDQFKGAFALFDKDGNGFIDSKELGQVLRQLGQNPTDEEVAHLIKEADADGNGKIDFNEFLTLVENQVKKLNK